MKKKKTIRKKQRPDINGLTAQVKSSVSEISYYPKAIPADVSEKKKKRPTKRKNLLSARDEEHEGRFLTDNFIQDWKDSIKDF